MELAVLNDGNLAAIRDIIGAPTETEDGKLRLEETETSRQLRDQGRRWAHHILEGPISWIMSAAYIFVTVVYGATPLSALLDAVRDASEEGGMLSSAHQQAHFNYTNASASLMDAVRTERVGEESAALLLDAARALTHAAHALEQQAEPADSQMAFWEAITYMVATLDACVYLFLPWWTTVLVRLAQGRPWLHRVAGRSILIGDVPWVAQSIEAYVSKLFALAYKNSGISVASANPVDHLVHRHTHRVVRGSLLAVGRPDGRLNALTSAENTVCLSLSQASSIQNYGVTCEVRRIATRTCRMLRSCHAHATPHRATHMLPAPPAMPLCGTLLPACHARHVHDGGGGVVGYQFSLSSQSITIGHNPFELPLSKKGICLPRNRPLFLCEKELSMLRTNPEMDLSKHSQPEQSSSTKQSNNPDQRQGSGAVAASGWQRSRLGRLIDWLCGYDGSPRAVAAPAQPPASAEEADGEPAMSASALMGAMEVLFNSVELDEDGELEPREPAALEAVVKDVTVAQNIRLQVRQARMASHGNVVQLKQPFLGAWMATSPEFREMTTAEAFARQKLVQVHAPRACVHSACMQSEPGGDASCYVHAL